MDNVFRIALLSFATLLGTIGCVSEGTCVYKKGPSEGVEPVCMVHVPKSSCGSSQDPGEFFAEDSPAGVMRCISLGYTELSSAAGDGAVRVYRKKTVLPGEPMK